MSAKYSPDDDAKSVPPWTIAFLSNRDLSAQLPINFATHPGVVLGPACFSNGTYSASVAEKCISNLIAAQFRRLVIDLYWDASNAQFTFCPVAIPAALSNGSTSASISSTQRPSIAAISTSRTVRDVVVVRQTSSLNRNSTFSSSTISSAPSNTASTVPVTTSPSGTGEVLYHLGPYQCSPTLDLPFLTSLIADYVEGTSNTIEAKLLFLMLNLHAAASSDAPEAPADEPSILPGPDVLVGAQFLNSLHSSIYRPSLLESDRSNLNKSWFRNPESRFPIAEYFTIETMSNGDLTTPDGWPDENYVQLTKALRFFLGWGTIDPQMSQYNFSGDADTIFAPGILTRTHEIETSTSGELTTGCLYDADQTGVTKAGNSSWVVSSNSFSPFSSSSLLSNLTACGISPLLNTTISRSGASTNIPPFTSIAQNSLWNWATGEPRNHSASGVDLDEPQSQFRCAYFDATDHTGRWLVAGCQRNYRAACRINNQPYAWTLSSSTSPYASSPDACPPNSSFSLPRTGLENHHLYAAILASRAAKPSTPLPGVWVNFNSLDVEACWVTTGPNGTCPYFENPSDEHTRRVLVPTVAAIIILIITSLTVFVKCNVNRRNSRSRRRGDGGWDYEGVPS